MTSFPGSPRTLKGGFVLMDADGKAVLRTVAFQYNPDGLSRTLTPRGAKIDAGDRLEGLRLVGPPIETIKIEIEIDATDRLEKPGSNADTVANGIAADLAELEAIISPSPDDIAAADGLARSGTLEVLPLPSPLVLLALGRNRLVPVRITEFSIVEEAFDTQLNPIRARVSLGMRALSIDDLAFGSKGAELFMVAARRRDKMAKRRPPNMQALGLTGVP
ncbi:hypothetical protein [Sphingopyxis macrogoltabida]|uniref:Uncharacterized protein n=1 Tax=Sphingopyxis macrogoltabida TaxID=33050 RepID=A0AAC8YZT1_SPHMC|nr:hypothetical protein [Sphingopyxis macrogoltabida]ALJ13628.1 signal peptide protein [Sphingopyxis macrogoltabida]AMU88927.1 hypothetical protein ATM17_07705 [Sphingopyxis macrogoltabida]